MTQFVGIVPARGGSKGLPGKNIIQLNGKPLLGYTLEAVSESEMLNDVYVCSDSSEILAVASAYGAKTDKRPDALAQDDTAMNDVLANFIERHQLSDDCVIVLLQPTSPLRSSAHIDEALQWYLENQCHALISVFKVDSRLLYAYVEDEQFLKPASPAYHSITARQGLPNLYMPNGAIYVFSVAAFKTAGDIPSARAVPFIMSEEDSIDIDSAADLRRCSRLLLAREAVKHSL